MFAIFKNSNVFNDIAAFVVVVTSSLFATQAGAQNVSNYQQGEYGTVSNVRMGVIRSMRQITISTEGSNQASVLGGVLGGAVGAYAGNRSSGLMQVAAATIGAAVGTTVGRGLSSRTEAGTEYIVQTSNGGMISVTQADAGNFAVGQTVGVIEGRQARIVPLN